MYHFQYAQPCTILFYSLGSQNFTMEYDFLFPYFIDRLKNDYMRGNFLAAIGREESDNKLLFLIRKHFAKGRC